MGDRFLAPAGRPRLDQFVADRLAEVGRPLTRSQVRRLIDEGHVRVEGEVVKAGEKLHEGVLVTVEVPAAQPSHLEAEAIPLTVLYEDEHLIVIDKPPGLVVHPAPGHPGGTLVNALLGHCQDLSGVGGELRPGIVHRLDRDTSGVMVVSKHDQSHARLAEGFRAKRHQREYLAVVAPPPRVDRGRYETLYGRHPTARKKFSSKVSRGKTAVTHFTVERRFAEAALLRLVLETGRTHQIRVHCADHGHPVLGDPVYGRPPRSPALAHLAAAIGRQALHAAVLGFIHPITGAPLRFETAPPADFAALVAALAGATAEPC